MSKIHAVTDQTYAQVFHAWMAEHLGITFDPESTRYIASVVETDDGQFEIAGCTAVNHWTEGACEAHAATDRSKRQKIDRAYIWTTFDYVFNHADKNCMFTYVSVDNHRSLALQEMLGLTKVGLVPGFYGEGKDSFLFSITKQQWLDGEWGSLESPKEE
jgi:RimJ/RimL family protein N-acetyltransferase